MTTPTYQDVLRGKLVNQKENLQTNTQNYFELDTDLQNISLKGSRSMNVDSGHQYGSVILF